MKRLFVFIVLALFTASAAYAHDAGPRHAEHPVVLPKTMPVYSRQYRAYGTIQPSPVEKDTPRDPNTITVTAIVLPARIIVLDGKTLSVTSNTIGKSLFIVQDKRNHNIALTDDIWQGTRACLLAATKATGVRVCSIPFSSDFVT